MIIFKSFDYCPVERLGDDDRFSILSVVPYPRLLDSIAAEGITSPLIADGTERIVCGRNRLRCARELKMDRVPVLHVSGEPVDLFRVNMAQTFCSGNDPDDAVRALSVGKLSDVFGLSISEIVDDFLPRMEMDRSMKMAKDCLRYARFSPDIFQIFLNRRFSLKTARIFFPYSCRDRHHVCRYLDRYGVGENRFRKIGEWVWHISQRLEVSPAEVLDSCADPADTAWDKSAIKRLEKRLSAYRFPSQLNQESAS